MGTVGGDQPFVSVEGNRNTQGKLIALSYKLLAFYHGEKTGTLRENSNHYLSHLLNIFNCSIYAGVQILHLMATPASFIKPSVQI